MLEESQNIIPFSPALGYGFEGSAIDIEWKVFRDKQSNLAFCLTIWDDNEVDWDIFSIQKTYRKGIGVLDSTDESDKCLQTILDDLRYFKELLDMLNLE